MFGHADPTRRFLPAGFAICNSENSWAYSRLFAAMNFLPRAVMADGLAGLQSAMNEGFGNGVLRIMCFYHAIVAMERNMTRLKLNKAQKEMIKDDILFMQRSETEREFFKLAGLFVVKWRGLGAEAVF